MGFSLVCWHRNCTAISLLPELHPRHATGLMGKLSGCRAVAWSVFPAWKGENQQGLSRGKGLDRPLSCAQLALGGRKDNLQVEGACRVSLCWGLRREWELLGCPLVLIRGGGDWGAVLLLFPLKGPQEWAGICVNHPRAVSQASGAASLLHIHPARSGSVWRWTEDPGSCLDLHFPPEPGMGRIFHLTLDGNISISTILYFYANTTKNQKHKES